MAILSDAKARNVQPGGRTLPHGGVTGLSLHPSPTRKGAGKWVLRYVSPVTGRRRNAGLGAYPDIGISQAGKLAQTMRDQIVSGQDPLELKSHTSEQPIIPSFSSAAKQLHTELKPGWKNTKHAQQWIRTLEEYAFPVLGTMPLDQIQPRHVADALRPVWLDKPETASRIKQRLHAVMAWGWAHGHNTSNPVDVVTHLLPLQPSKAVRTQHQPAMPWKLLPIFIRQHLSVIDEYETTKRMLLFLIVTAARSGEVRGMTWDEVDLKNRVWTVPASRMKAKQQHRVPLSEQALAIVESQKGQHELVVFPSSAAMDRRAHRKDGSRPAGAIPIISDMSITALLRRLKAESDTPGRYATAHGFRSSFRDWCSENGVAKDLAERSLAHTVQNKVEAAYHRTDLLEQRRALMAQWADFVVGRRPLAAQREHKSKSQGVPNSNE